MSELASLSPEWRRIELLGACLAAVRRGAEIPSELKTALEESQGQVLRLRSREPWSGLTRRYGLSCLDQDILACLLAPEAEPRIGWRIRELQPGDASPFPSAALIRELLFLDSEEAGLCQARLGRNAPLCRAGLVESCDGQLFAPLRPLPKARRELLGWQLPADPPPGAVPVPSSGTWESLVLPESCKRQLDEFVLWITHRRKVEEEWGGRLRGGPVALFAGPSGTGKTFAAEVIARTLDLPLFSVDLGRLVSKYIGETEKNLNALFNAAHGQSMILLFDEADSLFGKRGEIKDARDRYANMEVSHLLSRIERHRGPCILTSNLRRHLDPAFARRFQVVVEFPRPDAAARSRLWELHLPQRAPREAEVCGAFLGEALSLTGGQINNAALHAAFLAAGEDHAIGLRHVARAVWQELGKEGHDLKPTALGRLEPYLNQGAA